ncbi:MAG TPA: hypothetical protein VGF25_09480 [Thermoleophilaceae bacterium]|jgi:hypothetical protein
MPYVIRPPRPKALLAAVVAALALAAPAAAEAACPANPVTNPFARFGDTADYSLLAGGDFESGAPGWTLSNAYTIFGNESYKVGGSSDSRALRIRSDGTAVSPSFCVGIEHPGFRFFARQSGGTWATMLVKLRWTDQGGNTRDTTVGALNGGDLRTWGPTQSFALARALPLWQAGQSLDVRLVFDPEDWGGGWAIDDVYIDPYAR